MYKTDLAIGIGLFAFGALMAFVVIPVTTFSGAHYGLPPTFFPTLVASFMMFFSICLVAQSIYRLKVLGTHRGSPISRLNLLVFALAITIIVGGVVTIDFAGLFVGAPLMIAALMALLGERNIFLIVFTSATPVVAIHLLARHVLMMPLP